MNRKAAIAKQILSFLFAITFVLAFACCSSLKSIPEGSYSLEGVKITVDDKDFNASSLGGYLRQRPNAKWFSLFKKPGAKPVVFDPALADKSCQDLQMAMRNMGYLHATADMDTLIKGKKLKVVYNLHPREQYYIRDVRYDIQDDSVKAFLDKHEEELRLLKPGERFSISLLNDERKRITSLLTSNGYYSFHKEYISFGVDTAAYSTDVDVELRLQKYRPNSDAEATNHPIYTIRNISYHPGDGEKLRLRQSVLTANTAFEAGQPYSSADLQTTYNRFARMHAVRYTNVKFTEVPDTTLLDCDIEISTNKPSTISFLPEGTNTAGDLGAAVTLTYENRNIFHGSEQFSIQGRAAYEAIRGLEGYKDKDFTEYAITSKLAFPRILVPFRSRKLMNKMNANSELAVSFDMQNRPEFHRRLFSASWRYRWTDNSGKINYRFDLIDLNYVYMPWISDTFRKDYLDDVTSRNAILRYMYQDLFIMKIGFGATINRKSWVLRTNIETAGNLLNGLALATKFAKNKDGQYTLFHIAYAQYVRGDIDFTRLIDFDGNNQLAIHAALGIAFPYGNSNILPFEKRYFSGGANSVRGWSVRSLGPGRFRGTDGRIDFINQTGDMKIDFNIEYRTKLFWKFSGAAFIDAGNVWTIRNYKDQPDGQFSFREFYKQIAVSYGLGIRLNFGYFILRFDFGMKAINPAYSDP